MNSQFAMMMLDCCLECDFDAAAVVLEDDKQQYTLTNANRTKASACTSTGNNSVIDTASIATGASVRTLSSEQCDDCPLCMEPMHSSDWLIPMLCPLAPRCPFNYCTQCVWNLLLASSQPYQEASDGSNQLKVPLQCPQCRTKYPHRQTVQDVLLLRQAWRVQPMFFTFRNADYKINESSLRASELATKHAFGEQVTYTALQEAWARTHQYFRQLQGASATLLPALPTQWKDHLRHEKSATSPQHDNNNTSDGYHSHSLVDPTLFCGLEESMTLSEQQFLSELLTSGQTANLVRAAHVLNGILTLLQMGRHSSLAKTNTPQLGIPFNPSNNPTPGFRVLTTNTDILYPDMDTAVLRKRFKLPVHMPRWISMPLYHPEKKRTLPLVLQEHKHGLEIIAVGGQAGKQGLRKGDVVTHVDDEVLTKTCVDPDGITETTRTTVEQYHHYIRQRFELEGGKAATMTLVVNAHPDVANELQERAKQIIQFLTHAQRERKHRANQQSSDTSTNASSGGAVQLKSSW